METREENSKKKKKNAKKQQGTNRPYLELMHLNYSPTSELSGYVTANGKQISTMLCN